jgi:hypothetical protein
MRSGNAQVARHRYPLAIAINAGLAQRAGRALLTIHSAPSPCARVWGAYRFRLQDPRRMPKCVQISPSLGQAQTVVLTFRAPALIRPVGEALFEGFGQQSGRLVTSSLLHRLQKLEQ